MLMAQLRGKVAGEVWLGSEDLLTSAVLGTLKNLPAAITIELLGRAQPLEGTAGPRLSAPLAWSFWPLWARCEPDVVIEDADTLCVVEAKLYSEFGEDTGGGRQLRREWLDGVGRSEETGKALWLIALTNHATMPREAIRHQLGRSGAAAERVCWLSWSEIGRLLQGLRDESLAGWREDLLELLQRMGLAPYDGLGDVVAYARDLLWPALPWVSEFRRQGLSRVGFGGALAYAGALGTGWQGSWRLAHGAPARGKERDRGAAN